MRVRMKISFTRALHSVIEKKEVSVFYSCIYLSKVVIKLKVHSEIRSVLVVSAITSDTITTLTYPKE